MYLLFVEEQELMALKTGSSSDVVASRGAKRVTHRNNPRICPASSHLIPEHGGTAFALQDPTASSRDSVLSSLDSYFVKLLGSLLETALPPPDLSSALHRKPKISSRLDQDHAVVR